MTTFPGSPQLLKGALVSYADGRGAGAAKVITFQYNPETLTRTLEARTAAEGDAAESEALRLTGAPVETIKLEALIDATDQLEAGDDTAQDVGIHPQLALLELLVYPRSQVVLTQQVLANLGLIEVLSAQGPFVLFVWGKKRVLPVRLTEFSITEEFHDPRLNPIRAKVALGLRVLSYSDLPFTHRGWSLFMNHQTTKEALARLAPAAGETGVEDF